MSRLRQRLPAVSTTVVSAAFSSAAATTAVTATAAAAAATTSALTRSCLVDTDHATHPFDVLKVVNGLLFVLIAVHFHESETALAAGFAIKRKAGTLHLAVLAEQIEQIFLLGLKGEVADVDGHFLLGPMDI